MCVERVMPQDVYYRDYPVATFLELVGDAWTPIVLHQMAEGPLRYGVLLRSLPDISKKMLTQTLRKLERAGALSRTIIDEAVVGTCYQLTDDGRQLLEPLAAICQWSTANESLLNKLSKKPA